MYLILCWSYFNHSLHLVGKKKNKIKKRILNRNRNIGGINHNSIIFPNRSALVHTVCICVCICGLLVCCVVLLAVCGVVSVCVCLSACLSVCLSVCVHVCVCVREQHRESAYMRVGVHTSERVCECERVCV